MPDPKDVHIDQAMTALAIQYRNPAFKASEFLPIIPVKKESDKYFKGGREELRDMDALRKVGAEAKEVGWDISSESYNAEEYALKKLIPDRIVNNSDKPVRPKITTVKKLMKWLGIGYEKRAQVLIQTTANVQAAATPTIKWNGGGTVTIEADVDAAKKSVRQNCGAEANKILLSPDVRDVVKKDSTVRNLIRYTMPAAKGLLTSGDLPPVLWNLKTVIPGAVENTANEGQSDSLSDIWNDNVLVAFIEPNMSLDALTLGFTLRVRQNGTLEVLVVRWRDNGRKGEMIEVSILQAEKIVARECGYLITDTLH